MFELRYYKYHFSRLFFQEVININKLVKNEICEIQCVLHLPMELFLACIKICLVPRKFEENYKGKKIDRKIEV